MGSRGIFRGRIAGLFGGERCDAGRRCGVRRRCGVWRRGDALALVECGRGSDAGTSCAADTGYELILVRRRSCVERRGHRDGERLLPIAKYLDSRELANKRDFAVEAASLGRQGRTAVRYLIGAAESCSWQLAGSGSAANGDGRSRDPGVGLIGGEAGELATDARIVGTWSAPGLRLRLERLVQRPRSRQIRWRTLVGARVFPTVAESLLAHRWRDSQPCALDATRVQFPPVAQPGSPARLSCFDRQVSPRLRPPMSIVEVRQGNSPRTAGRIRPSSTAHHLPLPLFVETLSRAVRIHQLVAIPDASPHPTQAVQLNQETPGSRARLGCVAIRGPLWQAAHPLRFRSARSGLAAAAYACSLPDSTASVPCSRATSANTSPNTPSADGERP